MGSYQCLLICAASAAMLLSEASGAGAPPTIRLNDGHDMPGFGLGTWLGFRRVPENDDSVQKAVEAAIDTGYRHIDTAAIYKTEDQVGRAVNKKISEGVVKREDLFITTKLWNDQHAQDQVVPALQQSLRNLQLDYVDLYLIHWPMAQFENGTEQDIDYVETWRGMQEARERGLARSIGVSNFNKDMLERLIQETGVTPAVLQVEMNLNLQQGVLREYCRQRNVAVMAYSPFGSLFPGRAAPGAPPPRADDSTLLSIAEKHNKTVPQVVLRYLVELDAAPIPKTVTASRVRENFDVFDFQLSDDERAALRGFDSGHRTIDLKFWSSFKYYPFEK